MWTVIGILILMPVLGMAMLVACSDFVIPKLRGRVVSVPAEGPVSDDFRVLVPIYGSTRYLENLDYLRPYGPKVWFVTTTGESEEFGQSLAAIAAAGRHRIVRVALPGATEGAGVRATSAPIRDELVAAAAEMVPTGYVVMLDADTTTDRPLDRIVGEAAAQAFEVVSVRVEPPGGGNMLEQLQAMEYAIAMDVRRGHPWLLSGAFHVFTADALRGVMRAHSRFFQGNDVEAGALAHLMGFRTGHLATNAWTAVPDNWRAWWRQRVAWSGGVFRLAAMNARLARLAPLLVAYLLFVYVLWPVRVYLLVTHPITIVYTCLAYWALWLALYWRRRNRWVLLLPFYGLVQSIVLVPVGVIAYVRMVRKYHDVGVIDPGRLNFNGIAYAPDAVQAGLSDRGHPDEAAASRRRWTAVMMPM